MVEIIEYLIYISGSMLLILTLLYLIRITCNTIFKLIFSIKKVDFAWRLVMSAKRRNDTAEDLIDDIIGMCSVRVEWSKENTDRQIEDIKRVLNRILAKQVEQMKRYEEK